MPYEVKPWKQPGCDLAIPTNKLSNRIGHSEEINQAFGEGGGLNANYQTVEAVAVAADKLRGYGFKYGIDYIFKTGGHDTISLDFANPGLKQQADKLFADATPLAA